MTEIDFKVTVDEANLILEGLGHLPFAKVYALVAKLQQQANVQLQNPTQLGGTPAGAQAAAARVGVAGDADGK